MHEKLAVKAVDEPILPVRFLGLAVKGHRVCADNQNNAHASISQPKRLGSSHRPLVSSRYRDELAASRQNVLERLENHVKLQSREVDSSQTISGTSAKTSCSKLLEHRDYMRERSKLRRYRTENSLVILNQKTKDDVNETDDESQKNSRKKVVTCLPKKPTITGHRKRRQDSAVFKEKRSKGQCYNLRDQTITSFEETSSFSDESVRSVEIGRQDSNVVKLSMPNNHITESFVIEKYMIHKDMKRTSWSCMPRRTSSYNPDTKTCSHPADPSKLDNCEVDVAIKASTFPLDNVYKERREHLQRGLRFKDLISCGCANTKRKRKTRSSSCIPFSGYYKRVSRMSL